MTYNVFSGTLNLTIPNDASVMLAALCDMLFVNVIYRC